MTAPSALVRAAVQRRDGGVCVVCHTTHELTFQHRRAVGMGGSKFRPGAADGLTACLTHNQAFEADLQSLAKAYGWKAERWTDPTQIPVYYPHEFQWFRFEGEERFPIVSAVALDLMHAAYGDRYFLWRTEVSAVVR